MGRAVLYSTRSRFLPAFMNTAQPLPQLGDVERLFHDARDLEFPVFLLLDGPRVGGQNDDFPVETLLAEPPHEIDPRNPDHLVIGDDEIERGRGRVEQIEGFVAVLREGCLVAGELQNDSQGGPGSDFVVNDQDVQPRGAGCIWRDQSHS